ncbi:MAG: RNA polymerase sigma factor [Planctomycetes bacterium]|nr:RNA polymerase sigma factor [Planctomycetota bacterium]
MPVEDLLRQEPSFPAYLLSLVGRIDVAEDLVQETYLKAVRALDAGEIRSPQAWLRRVAYCVAVDYQPSRAVDPTARAREILSDLADPEAREPGYELLVREETEPVCRAIDEPPPMQRALLANTPVAEPESVEGGPRVRAGGGRSSVLPGSTPGTTGPDACA